VLQKGLRKQGLKQNFFPLRGKTFTKNAYAKTFKKKFYLKNAYAPVSLVKLSFLKERLLQESPGK